MVAGTNSVRMMVASSRTERAIPRPISFTTMIEVKAKAPATITKRRAAFVMTPPVFSSPRATDERLLWVSNHSSRTRLSKNTS